jgi:hypothetical protein
MVERPIKKSERQAKPETDSNSENADFTPPVKSTNPKSSKNTDGRSSGRDRDKKGSFGDDSRQPSNPALARGPKPVKPQPKVEAEPETLEEPISEETQD